MFTYLPERPDSERDINRITSSKTDSSQGMANGPWYVARTTNLLQLAPTQTATCPAGTSDGMRLADMRDLFLHRRSICRSLTM
ncbi:hypothetical protein V6N13_011720 [Hibiscus sabdariffa]